MRSGLFCCVSPNITYFFRNRLERNFSGETCAFRPILLRFSQKLEICYVSAGSYSCWLDLLTLGRIRPFYVGSGRIPYVFAGSSQTSTDPAYFVKIDHSWLDPLTLGWTRQFSIRSSRIHHVSTGTSQHTIDPSNFFIEPKAIQKQTGPSRSRQGKLTIVDNDSHYLQ